MTGPYAVRELLSAGHDVWLLHRSHSDSPLLRGSTQIAGDKSELPVLRQRLAALNIDVIVHMIAFTETEAVSFVDAVAGIVPRAVVISSIDVYRAYGRLHRTEPGPPDPTPLREDAPLRSNLSIHGSAYDKTAVERIVRSNPALPCTVVRYPAVYGPGDKQHRLHGWVRRMNDDRPFILMGTRQARWRFTHGYVENMAHALTLAITHPVAVERVYNVGELHAPTMAERAHMLGRAAGWAGRVVEIPEERLPVHLAENLDYAQDWVVDTSRIREELGYEEIVPTYECLEQSIIWERTNPPSTAAEQFDYAAEDAAVNSGGG